MWAEMSRLGPKVVPRAKLRRLAGLPSYVTDGTRWAESRFPKTESQLAKGCVRELRYAMPWPTPQRYSYCFDKSRSACPQIQLGVMVSRLTSELAGMTMN